MTELLAFLPRPWTELGDITAVSPCSGITDQLFVQRVVVVEIGRCVAGTRGGQV